MPKQRGLANSGQIPILVATTNGRGFYWPYHIRLLESHIHIRLRILTLLLTVAVHANGYSQDIPTAHLSSTMNPTSSKNSSKQDCINPALLNTLDNPSRPSKSSVSSSSSPNHVSADYILQKGNDDRGDGLKRAEELLMRCGMIHPSSRRTGNSHWITESLSDLCECLEILVGNQPPMDVDTEVVIQPRLLTVTVR